LREEDVLLRDEREARHSVPPYLHKQKTAPMARSVLPLG
jgi:hypothetical protein